jgi:hypothetical protein
MYMDEQKDRRTDGRTDRQTDGHNVKIIFAHTLVQTVHMQFLFKE